MAGWLPVANELLRRTWVWVRRSGGESRSLAVEPGRGRGSGFEDALEGRHGGCAKVENGCWSVAVACGGGSGGGVVVLSVVGRVLMQVGCKKFATTPRLGSV